MNQKKPAHLESQETELKAGLCVPLGPSIATAGGFFGAVQAYVDFGVRVETQTNLSNVGVFKEANPMFECGLRCNLPFLKAELAFTEEGFKFERQLHINGKKPQQFQYKGEQKPILATMKCRIS